MWKGTPRGKSLVRPRKDIVERLHRRESPVRDGVEVREVDYRTDPREPRRDLEDVVRASDLADATHDLDAERDIAALPFEPGPQVGELLDHLGQRALARAAEQEARVEDDRLGSRDLGDPRRVVEHPDRHRVLLVALDVTHEPGDRRVHRKRDPPAPSELPELLGPRVVHPEAAREVDLAGRVTALADQLHRRFGRFTRGHARRSETKVSHYDVENKRLLISASARG